jgi:ribonuclease HI
MKIRVFTDGACSKNGQNGARASYAFWLPEHKQLTKADFVPDEDPQTNNRGELLAILKAVQCIFSNFPSEEIDLQVYTDSMYSKNCLTQWVIGWQANNWKTSSGSPVSHRDIIEDAVKRLAKFKNYCISYVPAHTGKDDELSKHNEIVDKMAVAILNPEVENLKIIHTNQEKPIEGLPIDMMGPPVSSRILTDWCRQNLEKLDSDELNNALLSVLTKTLKKNGLILEKQRLHKTNVYRLLANNLIAEKSNIIKEE